MRRAAGIPAGGDAGAAEQQDPLRRAAHAEELLKLQLRIDEELRRQLQEAQDARCAELRELARQVRTAAREAAERRAAGSAPGSEASDASSPAQPTADSAADAPLGGLADGLQLMPLAASPTERSDGAAAAGAPAHAPEERNEPAASPGGKSPRERHRRMPPAAMSRPLLAAVGVMHAAVPACAILLLLAAIRADRPAGAAALCWVLMLYPAAAMLLQALSSPVDAAGLPGAWIRAVPIPVADCVVFRRALRRAPRPQVERAARLYSGLAAATQALPLMAVSVHVLRDQAHAFGLLASMPDTDSAPAEGERQGLLVVAAIIAAVFSVASIVLHGAVVPLLLGPRRLPPPRPAGSEAAAPQPAAPAWAPEP
eukprot:TRINITY_DN11292_c0_g2_i2.p1 TRINITY_DN11292_c0_g2~~TRINITY_DN11292_c0_g2_i2.p1  ORF type:complete len:370 (+),score=87.92 TRINITY_DN11292_c0_g2_i2:841-1950(+)